MKSPLRNRFPAGGLMVGLMLLLIFSIFALIGAAIMNIFGVAYESKVALVTFFFMTLLVDLPLAPLSKLMEKRLLKRKIWWATLLFLVIDVLLGTGSILLVDLFDSLVQVPLVTAVITAMIFSLAEILLFVKTEPSKN